MPRDVFIKVSGQVIETPRRLDAFQEQLLDTCRATGGSAVFHVIPGGGQRVDTLRNAWIAGGQQAGEQERYHWLAIDVMEENAAILRERFAGEPFITIPAVRDGLRAAPGLPASWSVTSDSITYFLATRRVQESPWPLVVLLKDVDGVHAVAAPRRGRIAGAAVIPRLRLHDGTIEPRLASYPFDDHIATLASATGCPFHVVSVNHVERVYRILAGETGVPCTTVTVHVS